MNSPLLSVILATYNDNERILRCLDSINNQTLDNLEVIIINDQSTDGSDITLQTYCQQHPRFFYFEGKNKGAYPCRNQALALCQGTFIAFVDTDDWIELDMFESLINQCIHHQAQSAMCSVKRYNEDMQEYSKYLNAGRFPSYFEMNPRYLGMISGGVTHKVFLREKVEAIQLRFLEYKTSADLDFNWRYYLNFPKVAIAKNTWYNYAIRPNSLVTGKHGKGGLDIINVFADLKQYLVTQHYYTRYKWVFLEVACARLRERYQREIDYRGLFILRVIQLLGVSFIFNAVLMSLRKKMKAYPFVVYLMKIKGALR